MFCVHVVPPYGKATFSDYPVSVFPLGCLVGTYVGRSLEARGGPRSV